MVTNKLVVYLAGPLFSNAERAWNQRLKHYITTYCEVEVYLPQEECASVCDDPRAIYDTCMAGVEKAQIIVAVLDGPDVDSGSAYEVGYARALGKPVIGIRTDFRLCEVFGTNIMINFGVSQMISGNKADSVIFDEVVQAVNKLKASLI